MPSASNNHRKSEEVQVPLTRVLLVISNLEFGGAQRQAVELANHINPDKFNFHLCSLSPYTPLAESLKNEIQLTTLDKRHRFDFRVVFELIHLIRKYKIDIVHAYLFDAEIASRMAALLSFTNVKLIGSERNSNYQLKPIQLNALKLTNSLVDLIIANSQSGAIYNQFLTGLAAKKYRVVYNGVNVTRFRPRDSSSMRRELDIDPETIVVGIFASFKQQKNHPMFLEAVSQIIDQHPNLRLLFVGDQLYGGAHGSNTYHDKINLLIDSLNLRSRCIFLGNRDDVEKIYPICAFTVLPSHHEGCPNVALESMACGVAVVATEVSDNAQVVIHNETGYIVEADNTAMLADYIQTLLNEPETAARLGRQARERALDNYSCEKLAENTEKIYDEI